LCFDEEFVVGIYGILNVNRTSVRSEITVNYLGFFFRGVNESAYSKRKGVAIQIDLIVRDTGARTVKLNDF